MKFNAVHDIKINYADIMRASLFRLGIHQDINPRSAAKQLYEVVDYFLDNEGASITHDLASRVWPFPGKSRINTLSGFLGQNNSEYACILGIRMITLGEALNLVYGHYDILKSDFRGRVFYRTRILYKLEDSLRGYIRDNTTRRDLISITCSF